MKLKWVLLTGVAIVGMTVGGFQSVFTVRETPEITSIKDSQVQTELKCYRNDHPVALDESGHLNVLVWNIYKQNRENLLPELTRLSEDRQLVLLQEASLDDTFLDWLQRSDWGSNQVSAFKAFDVSSGVLNLSRTMPSIACANLQTEPWLRLPKSGLYAEYALTNGQTLISVNLHSVNFTIGTEEYKQQLESFKQVLEKHQGPLLIAGDFNSWSESRLSALKQALHKYHIKEVEFQRDNRKRFITGLPLDHIFYRGMELAGQRVPESDASDHNPLLAEFRIVSK
ncbi:endonuclease/exonuclease/phosphatase family protein [Vibrio sp. McD22-P3]|uniref:endonuclease/exonuclease/phosphatase family protein n=1 Tax=Vibrio sp. McD22-P3 TaxID=2724880 RepID=UPI001F2AB7BB|nr:endonuclease/exonuclease/phosphatase family protein [Vibrio sp. McD22-P3]MCF4175410.1 endonuclease/exonuclease/phosphatase family protein [Vibrio sp. McD22-P3]